MRRFKPADAAGLSPDRKVDLSGVLFPESTRAVKNLNHIGCTSGTDSSEFLFRLPGYDGMVTVTLNIRSLWLHPTVTRSARDKILFQKN